MTFGRICAARGEKAKASGLQEKQTMPRCCDAIAGEFEPCYASVLVAGHDLRSAVETAEESEPICPCVTAWCARCKRASFTVVDRALFPRPSAHLAHSLALRALVEQTLAYAESK